MRRFLMCWWLATLVVRSHMVDIEPLAVLGAQAVIGGVLWFKLGVHVRCAYAPASADYVWRALPSPDTLA